jgi:hypothetical protein
LTVCWVCVQTVMNIVTVRFAEATFDRLKIDGNVVEIMHRNGSLNGTVINLESLLALACSLNHKVCVLSSFQSLAIVKLSYTGIQQTLLVRGFAYSRKNYCGNICASRRRSLALSQSLLRRCTE